MLVKGERQHADHRQSHKTSDNGDHAHARTALLRVRIGHVELEAVGNRGGRRRGRSLDAPLVRRQGIGLHSRPL